MQKRRYILLLLLFGPSISDLMAKVDVPLKQAIILDWKIQDFGPEAQRCFTGQLNNREVKVLKRLLQENPDTASEERLRQLVSNQFDSADKRWRKLYLDLCERRRARRLGRLYHHTTQLVFTKHYDLGGSHYAYTEGQSDAQAESHFHPGSALCVWERDGLYGSIETLVEDRNGVIRDPAVSYDGRRILFAWKKSKRKDDYHLYEMQWPTREVRQLTFGLGCTDYEGAYLPNGDIVFNSTRCVQTVDCWWTEVSNLYTCDRDGRYLRRLSFDQVHTNYPAVMFDGRVTYTRWEYNDRGQLYPQPLFQMNPDGSGQTEFYGNNSWFPTTILHARGIPNCTKVLAVASGHHTHQQGKLALIDPSRGNQEASGVQLIAPIRATQAVRIDRYGQEGEQFQYPYPLNENDFLVTYKPVVKGIHRHFGIYYMDIHGRRELLAYDAKISCNQPFPLTPRERPSVKPSHVDYRKTTGTFYVQDVYLGPGLRGIPRDTVKKLRVVEMRHRAAGIGSNNNQGPAGGALISTPIAIANGAWDVKAVLGETEVYPDGSAWFTVTSRVPVYFQLIDRDGYVVQTMRSWSTLMPGENLSCVGCHENKTETPHVSRPTMASKSGAQRLKPFYGPTRGFSFNREIQPILDRHCIGCHHNRQLRIDQKQSKRTATGVVSAFSLLNKTTHDEKAKRLWSDSYLALTHRGDFEHPLVNWIGTQSVPTLLPPYHRGAKKSGLMSLLKSGHHEVKLSQEELNKIACWIDLLVPYCGDYWEANAWNDTEKQKYRHFQAKRDRLAKEERGNIEAFLNTYHPTPPPSPN